MAPTGHLIAIIALILLAITTAVTFLCLLRGISMLRQTKHFSYAIGGIFFLLLSLVLGVVVGFLIWILMILAGGFYIPIGMILVISALCYVHKSVLD